MVEKPYSLTMLVEQLEDMLARPTALAREF
jgi:hypothetical protein